MPIYLPACKRHFPHMHACSLHGMRHSVVSVGTGWGLPAHAGWWSGRWWGRALPFAFLPCTSTASLPTPAPLTSSPLTRLTKPGGWGKGKWGNRDGGAGEQGDDLPSILLFYITFIYALYWHTIICLIYIFFPAPAHPNSFLTWHCLALHTTI